MKKGISIWSFGDMRIKDVFKMASQAGFEGVELALEETGEIGMDFTPKKAEKIKEMAKENGLEIYGLASGLYWSNSLTSDDATERNRAFDIAEFQLKAASWLGVETILLIPGAVGVDFVPGFAVVDYETAYNRALDAVQKLAPIAQKHGVCIGIENVWNKFLTSPLELRGFIDQVNSPWVGSYLDVGNTMYNGYPEHYIKTLGNRIKKVHFKDYRVAVGGLDGFVDLLAGDVNYPAVMEAFAAIGYDGWVSAEMIPQYKHYNRALIENTSNAMDKILGR